MVNPRIVQFQDSQQSRVGRVTLDGEKLEVLKGTNTLYEILREAVQARAGANGSPQLSNMIDEWEFDGLVGLDSLLDSNQVLCPCTHPDPFRQFNTGTGLSHLGGVQARDTMHGGEGMSDSTKMGQRGLVGGKPAPGSIGAEPEWFFKSNGPPVSPGGELTKPTFGLAASEEPELAFVFYVDDQSRVWRVGTAIGNEFSDHIAERRNYLDLAASKLRPCAIGPELTIGEALPESIEGNSKIYRNNEVLWEKDFQTGQANMIHSYANLIHHHFKHAQWRQPDTIHIHFLGTDTVSSNGGVVCEDGDVYEISIPLLGRPLRNVVRYTPGKDPLVTALPL